MKAFIKKNEDEIANRSIALKKFFNLTDKQRNANEGNSEILTPIKLKKKFNYDK